MSTTYYSLYIQKVYALAKSLVIKSDAAAQAINQSLVDLGYSVDDNLPTTWKYYQNLAGQYHETDTPMQVISLDTLETIDFTVANLKIHRATAEEYTVGSTYYNALLRRFPTQENLIYGILHPVNIQTAIAASEGTILYANEDLVESQETILLAQIQTRIQHFLARWSVNAYTLTDELYLPAQLGIMYSQLPIWILNSRLENCRTNYVHTFHIREYLASHNRLDRYINELTIKQQLFLYRNILYIENNAGKQATFDWLVERLLTERNVPLAEYIMRHNLADMPSDIYPTTEFKRQAVNKHYSPGISEVESLMGVLTDENPLARSNSEVIGDTYLDTVQRFRNNRYTALPTKILDSSITDMSESGAITLTDFLLSHWIRWSAENRYISVVTVPHPKTGDFFQLPVKDAFILFLYCQNRAYGVTLEEIPHAIFANEVRKPTIPSFDTLRSLTETRYVSDDQIRTARLNNPVVARQYVSVQAFMAAVGKIFDRAEEHQSQYQRRQHMIARAQTQVVTDHFYMDAPTTLLSSGEPTRYEDWIEQRGYDVLELTTLEAGILAENIVIKATGAELTNRISLKELQKSLLKLMAQLSSYTIQFVQNINQGPILVADDPTIRLGDESVKGFGGWQADLVGPDVMGLDHRVHVRWELDAGTLAEVSTTTRLRTSLMTHTGIKLDLRCRGVTRNRVLTGLPEYQVISEEPDFHHIVIDRDGTVLRS